MTCGWPPSLLASLVTFSEQMPSVFRSVPGVVYPGSYLSFSDVLGAAFSTCHDFSIVNNFPYSRVPSEHSYSRFGCHVFRGGGASALDTVAAGNDFALLGCITASRPVGKLALSGSTRSHTTRRDVGTSINARTLYPARGVTAVVAYPAGGGRARYPIVVAYIELY